MAKNDSKSKALPSGAVTELSRVFEWLQSRNADFQSIGNIKIFSNTNGLADATNNLLKQFAAEVKSTPSTNRVTVIRFDQPAVIPVDQGWEVDLIPIYITKGPVVVGDEQLDMGYYFHLTKEVQVSGEFVAVLLLTQLA
ncbi:hypothetical protein F5Y04DRAFT_262526 [Hypomontagnella monticulosa]|nr:hypothetical protein F5Y04DRAFT_262526 [Hypomontagnella monticulosa]